MSDPRNQTALTAPGVERFVELDRRPSLVEASLSSARSISHTMTAVIQPQIDKHSAAIATMHGQVGTQGEAIAGAKTQLDAHTATIATVQGQIGTQGEAIASAKTQLDAHTATIATVQGQISTQGEAIASGKTRLDAQNETLTGLHARLTSLGETTARHDQAIAFALLGEEAQIQQLVRRIEWLEHHQPTGETPAAGAAAPEQVREMRSENEALLEANKVLFERVAAMEEAIRQLLARGPQGGRSRPTPK